jgi:poly(hydroxyalkanoate) depolymerase family esterase
VQHNLDPRGSRDPKEDILRKLGPIVAELTAARRGAGVANLVDPASALVELRGFGSNPGQLVARTFIPEGLKPGAPLVVVLHGCTQNAGLYDRGSGWSEIAAREGFALLYPEQVRSNNSNLCFNWYRPGDSSRGRGEAQSIAQMVTHLVTEHDLDPSRLFVTGLSAGGAMTSVMLATYPELFAGGAVIAGLPYASARTLPEALERMRDRGSPSRRALAGRARGAADHSGPPPTLSVWHGTLDRIVDPANATVLVDQWRDLHGVGEVAGTVEAVGQHRRTTWRDDAGRVRVEHYEIKGMGHGTPLALGSEDALGMAGPHMLEAGISSTQRIAEFWGLSDAARARAMRRPQRTAVAMPQSRLPLPISESVTQGPGAVIERALRAAGLMT